MFGNRFRSGPAAVAAVMLLWIAPAALAGTIVLPLERVTSNASVNVEAQLFIEISQANAGDPVFVTVTNQGPISSAVKRILFDEPGILDFPSSLIDDDPFGTNTRVEFEKVSGTPNNFGWAGPTFSGDYEFAAVPPIGDEKNGVDPGESVRFQFTMNPGFTFGDLYSAVDHGSFRIALHVGSLPGDQSDGFVTKPPPPIPPQSVVPLPSSFWAGLGLLGLAGLGRSVRRRRHGLA